MFVNIIVFLRSSGELALTGKYVNRASKSVDPLISWTSVDIFGRLLPRLIKYEVFISICNFELISRRASEANIADV